MITDELLKEVRYKAVRSGGKGGQNVNKVSTKVELYFDVRNSAFLSEEQKETLLEKLANQTDREGVLRMSSQEDRSQIMNKNNVTEKFVSLIVSALKKKKKRGRTTPTAASKIKRLSTKKILSAKKSQRRKDVDFDE